MKDSMEEEVRSSVYDLYNKLLNERRERKEAKALRKAEEKAAREEEKKNEPKLSKKERRQAAIDNWNSIISNLTGEEIDVEKKSVKKKKYKKWITDEDEEKGITIKKKKMKKRNYDKEFDPEVSKLQRALNIQDKFNEDLQNWFRYTMGPINKTTAAPTKSMVDLAAAINTGRNNSLGIIREIGNLKKVKADLVMKQKKMEMDTGSSNIDNTDLGLLGANIMNSINNTASISSVPNTTDMVFDTNNTPDSAKDVTVVQATAFDPATWDGPELASNHTYAESIDHDVVVEKDSKTGAMRFKAIRRDNGEELIDCPLPTSDLSRLEVNEKDKIVKGEFNEVYNLEII